MDKRLVEVFDYTLQRYTGAYRPLASINAFVDSELWSDSTGTGTYDNPYKTIAKVKSIWASKWAAWKVIMVNWYFDELTTINVAVKIIGAGWGIGGRAIFAWNITWWLTWTGNAWYLDNILIYRNWNYFYTNWFSQDTSGFIVTAYNSNCIFISTREHWDRLLQINVYWYYSVFYGINVTDFASRWTLFNVYGNNNTLYNCTKATTSTTYNFYWNNNHSNNTIIASDYWYKNLKNVNWAYLDAVNLNFNFLNTSPLYKTGSFNWQTQDYNHVWAGTTAMDFKATTNEFNDTGTATYTNLTKSWWDIYRPNIAIDWTMVSGLIDLWEVKESVFRDINNTYEQASGKIYRRMQQNVQVSARQWWDYLLKYGNDAQEVTDCPRLKCEYWKIIRVSWTWLSRVWNADPTFDIANFTTPSFQYCQVDFRFKTVT